MKTISFNDFRAKLSYNDYTAFVYDDGTQQMYSGGEISDDSIHSFEEGGDISICNMVQASAEYIIREESKSHKA